LSASADDSPQQAKEADMSTAVRLRRAVVVLGLLLAGVITTAQASDSVARTDEVGGVLAWGCGNDNDAGQCRVPASARHGVTAIAAGATHSLALKKNGSVVAWGCRASERVLGSGNSGQCRVPASARHGVTAIAAGTDHSLALK
jgi:hypothetical protein